MMLNVGILIFPAVEELDFVGPFEVLSFASKIQHDAIKVNLIAEESGVIQAFNGLRVIPNMTIDDNPDLDVLVIPGGRGRITEMVNPVFLEFIKNKSAEVKFLATVCTGAFFLAEAGLLTGKRATTHHKAFDELVKYNVDVVKSKVVQEGNIITSGGVSSGIDMSLVLLAKLFDVNLAQQVADGIEYDVNVDNILNSMIYSR